MTAPIHPVYCIEGWPVNHELELHSPCSGLYADGFAKADGNFLANGVALPYPFFTQE